LHPAEATAETCPTSIFDEVRTMNVQPYLYFHGRCDEALDFYAKALGAKVTMRLRFKDAPVPAKPGMLAEGMEEKVMHAGFMVGDTEICASDGHRQGTAKFEGFALSLTLDDAAAVDKAFAALLEGGEVRMPLETTFFAKRFGMVVDKFGILWILMTHKQ